MVSNEDAPIKVSNSEIKRSDFPQEITHAPNRTPLNLIVTKHPQKIRVLLSSLTLFTFPPTLNFRRTPTKIGRFS